MSSIAEFYSRSLANEVIKGMGEKARNGGTLGKAPLGYINVRARDGHGREIRIVGLNEERAQLHRMLRLPYYKGIVTLQGVEYPGQHEPLVDVETWQNVQTVLASRRYGERERQHTHHFKTTVYCGQCGARLLVQNTRNTKGGLYLYFVCARRQRTHDCAFRAVLTDVVEERMDRLYQTIQLSRQNRQLAEQCVREEIQRLERDKDRTIRSLTTRRTNLEDKRRMLLHAHYEGAMPLDLLKEEQAELSTELNQIECQLAAYQADAVDVRQRLTGPLTCSRTATASTALHPPI